MHNLKGCNVTSTASPDKLGNLPWLTQSCLKLVMQNWRYMTAKPCCSQSDCAKLDVMEWHQWCMTSKAIRTWFSYASLVWRVAIPNLAMLREVKAVPKSRILANKGKICSENSVAEDQVHTDTHNTHNDFICSILNVWHHVSEKTHFINHCEGWQWCSWWRESC